MSHSLQARWNDALAIASKTGLCHSSVGRRKWAPNRTAVRAQAPRSLRQVELSGHNVAILWDLDNIKPPSLAQDLAPAISELRGLLAAWGGSIHSIKLYANGVTYSKLDKVLKLQLAMMDVQVIRVQTRNQAADMQLTAEAYQHARSSGQQGCVVLVSNDTGFGPILAYIGSLGVITILVASLPSKKRLPHLLPALSNHPVARSCDATLSWRSPLTAARRRRQLVSSSGNSLLSRSGSSRRVPSGAASGWLLPGQLMSMASAAGQVQQAKDGDGNAHMGAANDSRSNNGKVHFKFIEAVWIRQLCQR